VTTAGFKRRHPGLALAVLAAASALGCLHVPESYPPPAQRGAPSQAPRMLSPFIEMSDAAAAAHIVADVSPAVESNAWRWTYRRPRLQFQLDTVENLRYAMRFTLPDTVLEATGPVTLTVSINGRALPPVRYDSPGEKQFEAPVPAEWLSTEGTVEVEASLDKVYVAPRDRQALGYILLSAGFLE
jgi:hypothetical protein